MDLFNIEWILIVKKLKRHEVEKSNPYIFPSFPAVDHSLSSRGQWTNPHDFWQYDGSWVWHADF